MKEEGDWVTDEVCEVSRKKQKARMRYVKSPGNASLKQEYQKWKVQPRKCADRQGRNGGKLRLKRQNSCMRLL